jgi:mannose-1-phosphate guanylyltransferase
MQNIHAIILAGGFGKRLMPLSTSENPKQFHDLTGIGISLFQQTLLRALKITKPQNIFPVVNITHKNLALAQTAATSNEIAQNIIFEPEQKNTANAIMLGLAKIKSGIVVVMPSDHEITGDFAGDIEKAIDLAGQGKIVTFGVEPESADSNFGYVMEGGFHEKPEPYQAEVLVAQGAMWNSGIFVFEVSTVLAEFEKLYGNNIPAISFDKALMEKTNKLATIKASFHWADLGNWDALKDFPVYKQRQYA